MQVIPVGESALLIELTDLRSVMGLFAALQEQAIEGVLEAVPAARTVLLLCDPGIAPLSAVARAVARLTPAEHHARAGEVIEVPVTYDGPDLDEVGNIIGISAREVIQWHTDATWQVAFCGFSPGFGYLATDDARTVPRRQTPRTSVPAGSVGLAAEFSGIYPRASPGGWQLIGHTQMSLLDLGADPPAVMQPGIRVRFVEDR